MLRLHRQYSSIILALGLFFLSVMPYAATARQIKLSHVNVLADQSLSVAISQIATRYAQGNRASVSTSFAPAREQITNISDGLEADIFITARENSITELQAQGLIDVYSKTAVAKNRLAFTTYRDNQLQLILIPKLPLSGILEKIDPGFSFTLGDPDYQTVGLFSMKAMRNYEMAGDLEPYFLFVRSPVDLHRVIAEKGGYGLMYYTEARKNPDLKILGIFPEIAHTPIVYHAVIVAGENMGEARKFMHFLASDTAKHIFDLYGFETPGEASSDNGHLARGSTQSGSVSPL